MACQQTDDDEKKKHDWDTKPFNSHMISEYVCRHIFDDYVVVVVLSRYNFRFSCFSTITQTLLPCANQFYFAFSIMWVWICECVCEYVRGKKNEANISLTKKSSWCRIGSNFKLLWTCAIFGFHDTFFLVDSFHSQNPCKRFDLRPFLSWCRYSSLLQTTARFHAFYNKNKLL